MVEDNVNSSSPSGKDGNLSAELVGLYRDSNPGPVECESGAWGGSGMQVATH